MIDLIKLFKLESEAKALLQKIERLRKMNSEKGRIGRGGMFDQIETRIRIYHNRREALLKKIKEVSENEK